MKRVSLLLFIYEGAMSVFDLCIMYILVNEVNHFGAMSMVPV